MSIWAYDLMRVDGSVRVYTRIQNEYTGQITDGIRDIFTDKSGKKYFRADHQQIFIDKEYNAFIEHENAVKSALEFYKKYKGVYSV